MTTPRLGVIPPHAHAIRQDNLPMRRYRCMWLDIGGMISEAEHHLPALPLLDAAHGGFARGALVETPRGPVAVEDLLPGDTISTHAHGALPVLWIGMATLRPEGDKGTPLTRIMADAFGIGRPFGDLVMGPGGRLMTRPRGLRARIGAEQILTPAHAIADGMTAFRLTLRQPVTLYHLALQHHSVITVNGLETETFHPGPGFERALDPVLLRLVMSAFPHIEDPRAFGSLAQMRLPFDTPELLDLV
ncbi:MAG: Hint domain-containing protein [Roseovarius sp.]